MFRVAKVSFVTAAAILTAAALAGCSSGGLPGSPPSPGSSKSPSSGAANGSGGSNGSGGAGGSGKSGGSGTSTHPPTASRSGRSFSIPKTCPTSVEVSFILGVPVPAKVPTATADSTSLVCEYLTPTEDGPIIDFEPAKGLTASNFAAATETPTAGVKSITPVSGIGTRAALITHDNGDESILVLAGKSTIDIAGGATSATDIETLAKQLLDG